MTRADLGWLLLGALLLAAALAPIWAAARVQP